MGVCVFVVVKYYFVHCRTFAVCVWVLLFTVSCFTACFFYTATTILWFPFFPLRVCVWFFLCFLITTFGYFLFTVYSFTARARALTMSLYVC